MTKEITTVQTQTSVELNKKLKSALKVIDKKLAQLGVGTNIIYKGSGTFKYGELEPNTVNIHSGMDLGYLIKALAKMKRVKAEYDETCKALELATYPICLWFGQDINLYIHDLELRVKIVANTAQIKALEDSKKELTGFLSQEDRLSETLTKLSSLLK